VDGELIATGVTLGAAAAVVVVEGEVVPPGLLVRKGFAFTAVGAAVVGAVGVMLGGFDVGGVTTLIVCQMSPVIVNFTLE
jgi:hypothetical protein